MRVLDLNTLYIDGGEGGVNTYLREKARCLADFGAMKGRRIRHAIVVPGTTTHKTALGASTLYTLKSPRVPGNAQHRLLVDFARITAILKEEKPDVIEVDCSYLLGHIARRALKPRKTAIVGFYHVHLPRLYTRAGRSWLGSSVSRRTETFAWRYARLCARPCDRVVVTTRDMHAQLEGKAFPRLEIVPLGVNLDLFRPRVNGTRPRVEGIDPSSPVVLYVGRLSREKDLQVLYDAHKELRAQLGTQLLIAGDGPLRRQAARFARTSPGVVYSGVCPYGEQLAELYRSADVLAVPGRNETFSLIVLEAFASGLPVVAVDEGGPSEICRDGPGELARAGDARDFAAKIRAALSGRTPSYCCRSQVETRYSWEKTFSRLLDVYESIDGAQDSSQVDGDPLWEAAEAAELRLQ